MVFRSDLLYCVCTLKCYLDFCLSKEIGDFPDLRAVVGEGSPFFALLSILYVLVLYCVFPILL